jgi:hypothetical protein
MLGQDDAARAADRPHSDDAAVADSLGDAHPHRDGEAASADGAIAREVVAVRHELGRNSIENHVVGAWRAPCCQLPTREAIAAR